MDDKKKRFRNSFVVIAVSVACVLNCFLSCVSFADMIGTDDDGDLDIDFNIEELIAESVLDIPIEYAEIVNDFMNKQAEIYASSTNGDMSTVTAVCETLLNVGALSYFVTPMGFGLRRTIDDANDLVSYYNEELENIGFLIESDDGTTDEDVTASDLTITGDIFAQVCERLKNQYAPHVQSEYDFLTWQNEVNPNYITQLTFYNQGFPNGWSECYLIPYYKGEDGEWFGRVQYHIYIADGHFCSEAKDMLSITADYDDYITRNFGSGTEVAYYPYMILYTYVTGTYADNGYGGMYRRYTDYNAFLSGGEGKSVGGFLNFFEFQDYYYQDLYTGKYVGEFRDQFTAKPTGNEDIDIGWMIFNEPMVLDGKIDFDPSRIDPEGTVSLTGDNVYEYTITNGDGGSTVMGDYIEKNYTYIYNGDTSGGTGGTLAPSVPDVKLDFDNYYDGVDDYVSEMEKFFQKVYSIIPEPIMNIIILSFGLLVAAGVIKIIFILK